MKTQMKTQMVQAVMVVLALVVVTSCGKRDASGTYKGTEVSVENGVSINKDVQMVITQTDTTISGTSISTVTAGQTAVTAYSNSTQVGTISGALTGDTINPMTVSSNSGTTTMVGCSGTFTGPMQLTGDNLTGTLSGVTNCGSITRTLTLKRIN